MRIDVLTIFPQMFDALQASVLGRAQQNNVLDIRIHDIRPYSAAKHKNTDDYPFGGGAGMLMTPQPIAAAIQDIGGQNFVGMRIYLSPRGRLLNQALARELSAQPRLLLLCGHYEGVDERIVEKYIDLELSIGDYVLTGGELAAMVTIDCVARHLSGVLGSEQSAQDESFAADMLLEYPQYTRPRVFEGMEVPEVLIGGDHARIAAWRRQQSLLATAQRRPELLSKANLSLQEQAWLARQAEDEAPVMNKEAD